MTHKTTITIIGGGAAGLSLALILADMGVAVSVVEKNKLPTSAMLKPSARTTALMHGSLDVLIRAGIWPDFQSHCARLKRLSIIDDSTYPRGQDAMIRQNFDADELGLVEFGFNIPLMPLTIALADKAKSNKNITVVEDIDVDQSHPLVMSADLVVGADGRGSAVRQWCGIGYKEHSYNQSAMTCLISHSRSHDDTSVEFHRNGGPCTFVPYAPNQSAVVWVEKTSDVDEFVTLSKPAFIQALQSRSRDILGRIDDLIVGPEVWPLMTLQAETTIAPKTILIAEAAHVASPIGAQGLNMSLRDVGALADYVYAALMNGQDVGAITGLKAYERARARDIAPRMKGIDLLNRAVANENLVVRGARRAGLQLMGMPSPLRSFLMQEGLSPRA